MLLPEGLLCLPSLAQESRSYSRRVGHGRGRSLTHEQDPYLLLCARKNSWALPELQNDLQQSTGVHASHQTIRNQVGLMVDHPLQEPMLTAQHFGAQMAFAIECQNWQVHSACNTVQHHQFGVVSVMIWGGTEGRTDFYRPGNDTLTAIRYQHEIPWTPCQTLRWCTGSWVLFLISLKWCGILSFLTHYAVHIRVDIQHNFFAVDIWCVFSFTLIFLSSAY